MLCTECERGCFSNRMPPCFGTILHQKTECGMREHCMEVVLLSLDINGVNDLYIEGNK